MNDMVKKTLSSDKNAILNCFFLRYRGDIWSMKVVSDFSFGYRKYHFWYPKNRKIYDLGPF